MYVFFATLCCRLMTAAGHSPDKYMMTDMLNSAMKLKNVDGWFSVRYQTNYLMLFFLLI